jgi:hypothetical protein
LSLSTALWAFSSPFIDLNLVMRRWNRPRPCHGTDGKWQASYYTDPDAIPRPIHVGFAVDKLALGQTRSHLSTTLRPCSFLIHWPYQAGNIKPYRLTECYNNKQELMITKYKRKRTGNLVLVKTNHPGILFERLRKTMKTRHSRYPW